MAKIGSTDLALVTARVKCCRLGAARLGFTPYDVKGPGQTYPCEYMWREVKPPTTQWTLVTEGVVCGKRPVASFSNILCNTVGPVPFTDTSTPAEQITFWYWDFGDGGTSNDQNPTHTYAAGFYTVTLYVSSAKGTSSATGYVSVMSALVASAAPNPVNIGVDATFTPAFTGGLAPYTYQWDFGDVLFDGLVAYWNLNEDSGDRVDHLVGGNDLTDVNTVTSVADGMAGKAASFDRANLEYLSCVSSPELCITGNKTFAAWIRPAIGSSATDRTVLSKRSAGAIEYMMFVNHTNNVLRVYIEDSVSGNSRADTTVPIVLGVWSLVMFWYDASTKKAWCAVNDETPVEGNALANGPRADVIPFEIGRSAATFHFWGDIDEVAVWSGLLSDCERAALYKAGAGRFYPTSGESVLCTEETPVYAYRTTGDKVASITVTSATGCTASDTVDVTVNASTLEVTFAMDPDPTQIGVDWQTLITFTPDVTPGVAPYTYDWDWGDGTAHGSTEIPTHTYDGNALGGTYDVVLTVTDANLATATASQTIQIVGV